MRLLLSTEANKPSLVERLKPETAPLKQALITFVATAAMMLFAVGFLALLQSLNPEMPFQSLNGIGTGGSLGIMAAGVGIAAILLTLYCCGQRKKETPPAPKAPPVVVDEATPSAIPIMGAPAPNGRFLREIAKLRSFYGDERMPKNVDAYYAFEDGDKTMIIRWVRNDVRPQFSVPFSRDAGIAEIANLDRQSFYRLPPVPTQN